MIAGWVVSLVMAMSGSTRAGQGAFEAIWVAAALSLAVVDLLPDVAPHAAPGGRAAGQTCAAGEPRAGSPARIAVSS